MILLNRTIYHRFSACIDYRIHHHGPVAMSVQRCLFNAQKKICMSSLFALIRHYFGIKVPLQITQIVIKGVFFLFSDRKSLHLVIRKTEWFKVAQLH